MTVAYTWGTEEGERRRPVVCDNYLPHPDAVYFRGITVRATPERIFRWLCQIAVAPYSYDWIDNRGRRSPDTLTPGAAELRVGQTMAVVFRLTSFDAGHQWTASTGPRGERLFGNVAMTYAAEPTHGGSRIVVRIAVAAGGPVARLRAHALAWGDLVMMRRQLLNLKAFAERDARAA